MDAPTLISRYERAKSKRYNFDHHWQEVADLVLPTREFNATYTPGEKRRNRIFSDVAPEAADSLASALAGMLTNTSTRWFSLAPSNPRLKQNSSVKKYLHDATHLMLEYFDSADSGFAVASHEMYLDLVCFGTGIMTVTDGQHGPRFQAKALQNFYLVDDDQGNMVEVYRYFKLPILEAYETFGDDLSEKTLRAIKDGDLDYSKEIEFVHVVLKRYERDPAKIDNLNKPYASYYVELTGRHIVSESGFDRIPYLTPRWSKAPEETYGRSPAMKVLPGIKVANVMARNILEACELAIRPPIMMPANSIEGPLRTSPGSLIYYRQGTRDFPRPLVSGANPGVGEALLQRQEARIEQAFFLDKLRTPQNDRMTATEIMQRRQESLMFASPMLARLYSEFLDPLIGHTFESMVRAGVIPDAPEALQGRSLAVEYRSPMATSKRAAHTQSFMQAMQAVAPLVQVNPGVVQNLDSDRAFRDIFDAQSVDPSYLKDAREVEMMRQQQAQMQQAAMQAEVQQRQADVGLTQTKAQEAQRKANEPTQ
jgi:hypothetical protein